MPPQCIKILLTACHRPTNEQGENFLKKKNYLNMLLRKSALNVLHLKILQNSIKHM